MSRKPEEGLMISPIRDGTVIDHIPPGEAFHVLRILGITGTTAECLSVATNVESKLSGCKDIVKISNRELKKEEVDRIALIAPKATINIIRNFRVADKLSVHIPKRLEGVIKCPNPGCISNSDEPIPSKFMVENGTLRCHYCDNVITRDIVNYII